VVGLLEGRPPGPVALFVVPSAQRYRVPVNATSRPGRLMVRVARADSAHQAPRAPTPIGLLTERQAERFRPSLLVHRAEPRGLAHGTLAADHRGFTRAYCSTARPSRALASLHRACGWTALDTRICPPSVTKM